MVSNNKISVLYISYDGMTDQLGQSQVLPYLIKLSENGISINILSFEKKNNYHNNKLLIEKLLEKADISWFPLKYTSYPPVISTIYDIYKLKHVAKKIAILKNIDIVHCRSYIASFAGIYLKNKLKIPFVFDMRGFWADERIDGNLWPQSNLIYKLIYKYFKIQEIKYLNNCDYIISLTENAKKEIISWNSKFEHKIETIPCCADFEHFNYQNILNNETSLLKTKLGIEQSSFVISYLGSIGTWYMFDELLDFFKQLLIKKPQSLFVIITNDNAENVFKQAIIKDIPTKKIIVTSASRANVPLFISISKLSIFFIKPSYSKKASSPTKLAEIMAMGIPVIVNSGYGDVADTINTTKCGITIDNFNTESYIKAIEQIDYLLDIPKQQIRDEGIKLFSLDIGVQLYYKVYKNIYKNKGY